jgi:hypothetical protein
MNNSLFISSILSHFLKKEKFPWFEFMPDPTKVRE